MHQALLPAVGVQPLNRRMNTHPSLPHLCQLQLKRMCRRMIAPMETWVPQAGFPPVLHLVLTDVVEGVIGAKGREVGGAERRERASYAPSKSAGVSTS